jgi:hypothetical protein
MVAQLRNGDVERAGKRSATTSLNLAKNWRLKVQTWLCLRVNTITCFNMRLIRGVGPAILIM